MTLFSTGAFVWKTAPVSNNWNTAANWSGNAVPSGGDVAEFGTSAQPSITISANAEAAGMQFNAGASAYTFGVGAGVRFDLRGSIVNNSASAPTFNVSGENAILFVSGASNVANAVINNSNAGQTVFDNTATAGSAVITNDGGFTNFAGTATAGSATISSSNGGETQISGNGASAGSATITANSNGLTAFTNASTAGSATLITNNGGRTTLAGTASGGTATVITNTGGVFSIAGLSSSGTTVGSIEGAGNYSLGGKTLTAGSLNTSTTVSGNITSSASGGLTKVGTGTLTLTGSVVGGLTVSEGAVQLGNGGTTGTAQSVVDNAGLIINRSDGSLTVSGGPVLGAVSGTGTVTIAGTGVILSNGVNTYSGGTTVSAGTLNVQTAPGTGAITMAGGTLAYVNGVTLSNAVVLNNATTQFRTPSGVGATQAGIISQSGGARALEKTDSGTLTFSATNTYTGATTVTGGTLLVNGSIASSSGVTVASGATLGGTGTVASTTVSNGGRLAPGTSIGTLSVSGTLALGTAAAYLAEISAAAADRINVSGEANLNNSVLTLSNLGGTYAAGQYTLLSATGGRTGTFGTVNNLNGFSGFDASITYDANAVYLVLTAQPITYVWKSSPASSDWNTAANWSGSTVPTAANTAFFDTSSQTTVNVTQNNTQVAGITFNAGASAYTINVTGAAGTGASSLVIGSGGIVNNSGSTQSFVVGGVSGAAGTLQLTGGSAANATISANAFGTASFTGGASGGTARLVSNAGGTVDISGLSGAGTTAGSIEGAGSFVLGSKNLSVGALNSSTEVSGTITGVGGGSLTKTGTGTLILSGNNSITGGLTITGGTVQLGNGGASGAVGGTVQVQSGATIAMNRSDALNFPVNLLSGSGTAAQIGSGSTTVSAAQSFTGNYAANAGTLLINADLSNASGFSVNGGTLGGTGTLSSTAVNSGTFAPGPGGSPGAIAVSGNLSFGSAGRYAVQLTTGAASTTNVTGTASLNGTVTVTAAAGAYTAGQSYTILAAAGGLGGTTFAGLSMSGGARAHLSYDADEVFLIIDPNSLNLANLPRKRRQCRRGHQPLRRQRRHADGLVRQSRRPQRRGAGHGADPALRRGGCERRRAGGQQLTGSFLNLMLNPFTEQRIGGSGIGPAPAYAAEPRLSAEAANAYAAITKAAPLVAAAQQRWSTWGSVYGGRASISGDAAIGSSETTARAWGLAAGLDRRLSSDILVGVAVAGGNTNWSLAGGMGGGRSDAFQFGAYATRQFGAGYLSGAVALARHRMSTERTVTTPAVQQLRADFDATNVGSRVEAGYRFATPLRFGVTPYAALQVQSLRLPGYGETGGSFALNFAARTASATRSELGSWFDVRHAFGSANVGLFGRLARAHDWNRDASASAVFQTLPGSSFVVTGAVTPRDIGLVTAGASIHLTRQVSLAGKFEGEFASGYRSYGGTGSLRYEW